MWWIGRHTQLKLKKQQHCVASIHHYKRARDTYIHTRAKYTRYQLHWIVYRCCHRRRHWIVRVCEYCIWFRSNIHAHIHIEPFTHTHTEMCCVCDAPIPMTRKKYIHAQQWPHVRKTSYHGEQQTYESIYIYILFLFTSFLRMRHERSSRFATFCWWKSINNT